MRRLYSFFVCLLVFAACSPRLYHGEQAARTFLQDESRDSAFLRKLVDRVVHDELQKHLDILECTEGTTVSEKLSVPDSTGAQYVTERTTTTYSGRKETSSVTLHTKDEKNQEHIDSISVHAAVSVGEREEDTVVTGQVESRMPWYVYVAALAAAMIAGCALALFGGKLWNFKKKEI